VDREKKRVGENKRVGEKMWQAEFYYAASELLTEGQYLSSEVGKGGIEGLYGVIDFVVTPDLWGIEFLLAGNKRDARMQRFDTQGGAYSEADLDDWAVVEFCQVEPSNIPHNIPPRAEHLWVIQCTSEFDVQYVFPPLDSTVITIPFANH
jgi:hypothetical protein